ncbi:CheY chemotaxis protein or a CheY-like REC (receiver) domain [Flexibacter flexilis DSM 6793]|uniref:CheY chemotaxis protein or a CheY-like REC (Receiver) domain n=1 Tax=Flexibacter flexilis DSM 6793 TaxID=927664 RepID=A0A1I1N1D9_9BACT|nr:response regulator [Flexibacter flexilis]SFC91461.1 CheY chemotaxis protein or a CheY-like REC (receiver) domain [Flexibacter flexilis DSM 6793]
MNTKQTHVPVSIYLIDDNEIMNFINARLIKLICPDTQVFSFINGWEAIAHIDSQEVAPSMIFVDIEMPIMNGWDFLDVYQKKFSQQWDETSVYMLSSSVSEADRQKALSYECVSDYYSKPITAEIFESLFFRGIAKSA